MWRIWLGCCILLRAQRLSTGVQSDASHKATKAGRRIVLSDWRAEESPRRPQLDTRLEESMIHVTVAAQLITSAVWTRRLVAPGEGLEPTTPTITVQNSNN